MQLSQWNLVFYNVPPPLPPQILNDCPMCDLEQTTIASGLVDSKLGIHNLNNNLTNSLFHQ